MNFVSTTAGKVLAAAAFSVFAVGAYAQKTQLSVYTALETDQLKAYKEGFEKANPTIELERPCYLLANRSQWPLSDHSQTDRRNSPIRLCERQKSQMRPLFLNEAARRQKCRQVPARIR